MSRQRPLGFYSIQRVLGNFAETLERHALCEAVNTWNISGDDYRIRFEIQKLSDDFSNPPLLLAIAVSENPVRQPLHHLLLFNPYRLNIIDQPDACELHIGSDVQGEFVRWTVVMVYKNYALESGHRVEVTSEPAHGLRTPQPLKKVFPTYRFANRS
jgi:hypothetical protein